MTTEATPQRIPPATPAAPPESVTGIVARLVLTGLVLWGYFQVHDQIVASLVPLVNRVAGDAANSLPGVLAVTLLSAALLAVWWRPVRNDKRFYAPLFITFILAVADTAYGILEVHHSALLSYLTGGRLTQISPTFVAILAAVAMEIALSRFVYGRWPHLASAYISGISVGILIKSTDTWPFVLCSLISITSKYAFRVGGRHLWNPSNFGITMMLLLAGSDVASYSVQSGNDIAPIVVIWILGCLILYSLGRLYLPVLFVAAFVPLALFRAAVTGQPWLAEVAPVTWPMFQLYIFFMITDPKTTTKSRGSQCLVVVLVALVETILRLLEDVHALYHALFIVGPISLAVEMWWTSRQPKAAHARIPEEQPVPPENPVPRPCGVVAEHRSAPSPHGNRG
jgi:hypothetical protein